MRKTVECEIVNGDLTDEETGAVLPGVRAECGDCGHETESFGDGELSRKRCLALMREQCPMGHTNNFYVEG